MDATIVNFSSLLQTIAQSECVFRGDLANINIGRQCVLGKRVVISPPYKKLLSGYVHHIKLRVNAFSFSSGAFYPLQIGDNTIVGNNTIINATVIGHSVYIGKNCVIVCIKTKPASLHFSFSLPPQSRAAVLRDCCRIEDNTVVPPETTVPSFTTYKGNPAQYVSDLPSCTQEVMMEATKSFYQHFKPQKK